MLDDSFNLQKGIIVGGVNQSRYKRFWCFFLRRLQNAHEILVVLR